MKKAFLLLGLIGGLGLTACAPGQSSAGVSVTVPSTVTTPSSSSSTDSSSSSSSASQSTQDSTAVKDGVTVHGTVTDGSLVFAGKKEYDNAAMTFDGALEEDLNASVAFVSQVTGSADDYRRTYAFSLTGNEAAQTAIGKGYVDYPDIETRNSPLNLLFSDLSFISDKDPSQGIQGTLRTEKVSDLESQGLAIPLAFQWGDAFDDKNPQLYAKDAMGIDGQGLIDDLTELRELAKTMGFTVTLTPVLSAK